MDEDKREYKNEKIDSKKSLEELKEKAQPRIEKYSKTDKKENK